ncbi:Pectate lyase superfamily protein [Polystyrenella longa]|uniref:Pectate lyase superfamily protein n=1 Tax=Polystyrenella longa TaxID=2528007 RepID=A0A518CKW2_9PLAN|nr:right-handed parallel beta-helix repeat-containing protein [Polystyrenella longa]QDU79868.1 Pectate lyase superfamily protein [Polystyrenella longa]
MRLMLLCSLMFLSTQAGLFADEDVLFDSRPNPELVAEVVAGTREAANAGWWGFDPVDSTEILQAAINSPAKKLIVPNLGETWIVRPITLRGDLELVFEPGTLVMAKRGEFKGGGDSLFSARDAKNLTIRGYGATWRMWKRDYQNPPYVKAEWRMGLALRGCHDVLVEGLQIESSGGDGIYIDNGSEQTFSDGITIRDCICLDHHRQGMSVISAKNLLVENCVFAKTGGTPPEAGIDFEPDGPDQCFINCVVRNCVFQDNSGHQILVYLKPMTRDSQPVDIRFENCVSRMGEAGMQKSDFLDLNTSGWAGIAVGAIKDDGPQGKIEFINCSTENTGKEGIKVFDKSASSAEVIFQNCKVKNSWVSRHQEFGGPRVPILIQVRRPSYTERPGGIDFIQCMVNDTIHAPTLRFDQEKSEYGLYDVEGTIYVRSPQGPQAVLGSDLHFVDVNLVDARPVKPEGTP